MAAKRKYNWNELFKQDNILLEYGEDYHCSQSNMIQQIRNQASKRKLRIRINDLGNQIIIKVLRGDNEVYHTDMSAVTS